MSAATGRNYEIDGIRGWAALFVILFHFFRESFGTLFPILRSDIFWCLLNGPLMVSIFFVLSGDALSIHHFSGESTNKTARLTLARYFRLTFPILISCLTVYGLMRSNLTFNRQAAQIIGRVDWLGSFIQFPPSLVSCLKYALDRVYLHHSLETSYNPFLWTIEIEFAGSMLVFINILILNQTKENWKLPILSLQCLFFLYLSNYFSLFLFGMILGHLRRRGVFERSHEMRCNNVFLATFLVLILLLLPFQHERIIELLERATFLQYQPCLFLIAGLLVGIVYCNSRLVAFFSARLSRFLGQISFPLYVLQFNVLVSYSSYLVIRFHDLGYLNNWYFLFIPLTSSILTGVAAYLFSLIEKRFLSLVNRVIKEKILIASAAA